MPKKHPMTATFGRYSCFLTIRYVFHKIVFCFNEKNMNLIELNHDLNGLKLDLDSLRRN